MSGSPAPVTLGKLVVIGVGLIGGSCALALRRSGDARETVGIGRTRTNLATAVSRGIIDRALTLDDDWTRELRDADMVLLAAPVAQYPALFDAIAPAVGTATIVTDAGSTKQDVVAAARTHLGALLDRFVPGHPIAGSEQSGATAASASLYIGKQVILTPLPETSAVALHAVADFWRSCGAVVTAMDAARHDAILAAISHLPHLLAFAYVGAIAAKPDADAVLAHAGMGFSDFTRIAGSSAELWRDIALANRDALLAEIEAFRERLDEVEKLIRAGDPARLASFIEEAARTRRRWAEVQSDATVVRDDEA